MPQHKARSTHTSGGWNPKAKWLCRQGNFKEVPTCSSHQLPCCRLQFPWSPWCNCLWGCSVNRLQTRASLNRVYKNALKQVLWSSFQHKPTNNNSKTNWMEHCILKHYFVWLCWRERILQNYTVKHRIHFGGWGHKGRKKQKYLK